MLYKIIVSILVATLFFYWLFCMLVCAVVAKYEADWKAIKKDNSRYYYLFRVSYIIGNLIMIGFVIFIVVGCVFVALFGRPI